MRENARDELIVEHICQAITQLEPLVIPDPIYTELSDREGVLLFGDEHYGTEFEICGLSVGVTAELSSGFLIQPASKYS